MSWKRFSTKRTTCKRSRVRTVFSAFCVRTPGEILPSVPLRVNSPRRDLSKQTFRRRSNEPRGAQQTKNRTTRRLTPAPRRLRDNRNDCLSIREDRRSFVIDCDRVTRRANAPIPCGLRSQLGFFVLRSLVGYSFIGLVINCLTFGEHRSCVKINLKKSCLFEAS